jgi:hypothetical protein
LIVEEIRADLGPQFERQSMKCTKGNDGENLEEQELFSGQFKCKHICGEIRSQFINCTIVKAQLEKIIMYIGHARQNCIESKKKETRCNRDQLTSSICNYEKYRYIKGCSFVTSINLVPNSILI